MEIVQESDIAEIMKKLVKLQEDVNFLKEHIVDEDSFMTEEKTKDLNEARNEYKRGESTLLEDLEKEMKILHEKV